MAEEVTPEDSSNRVELNPHHFRPGWVESRVFNFVIADGGIGDFICYLAALRWIADYSPQVEGRVYCPDIFVELAANVFKKYPDWRVCPRRELTAKKITKRKTWGPPPCGNQIGMHSVDLGFLHYCNQNPPPAEGNFYPQLDFSGFDFPVPTTPYVVMTPGSNSANRTMPAKTFNGIKDHILDNGFLPVFLGSHMLKTRKVTFDEGYDYDGGVDLRDKTTLLQAGAFISKAQAIVGLDNGLLHLAGMTETPIVFGYNIASPLHRRPRRRKGEIFEIYPEKKDLPCTFCQSHMRFVSTDFSRCIYDDNKCLDFLSDPTMWTELLDRAVASKEAEPRAKPVLS